MKMKESSSSPRPRVTMSLLILKAATLAVRVGCEPVTYRTVIVNSAAFQIARIASRSRGSFTKTENCSKIREAAKNVAKSANFAIENFSSEIWSTIQAN